MSASMPLSRRGMLAAAVGATVAATAQASRASTKLYEYDALGRLTFTNVSDGKLGANYRLDGADNRMAFSTHYFVGTTILATGLDPQYYLFTYPDIAAAGLDPQVHYDQYGWREGRQPSAYFNTSGYLSAYPDVQAAAINPLSHYMQYGWHEGRDPSGLFSTSGYLNNYADIAAAGINPYEHFLQYGVYEGRIASGTGTYRASS